MAEGKSILLKIKRQAGPNQPAHWEEFSLPWRPNMNVIACLIEIAENPVTRSGQKTTPVSYESNCLEEVCGACAMVINGHSRQACSALVDHLQQPITLEPMSKFPLVRDLAVDRSKMFHDLKRMRCWVPIDGTYALGPGPRISPERQQVAYALSRCMLCGNCLEVCPKVNENSDFVGAAILNQVRLFNLHPTGAMHAHERLQAVRGVGGVQNCDNAQNCVKACPKSIPLTESNNDINRQALRDTLLGWIFR